ncbi:GNAT family protein [Xanthomonadaceae bacterium XH05]|nr:GNAT family protein [Xanthomonadaceae bacterium XH05]
MIGPTLAGAAVQLRGWHEADLPALSVLRSDAALQAKLMARTTPDSARRVGEWLARRAAQPDTLLYVIAARGDDAVLGYLQAASLDMFHGHCELGICLSPEAQGRGIASAALELLYAYLRDQCGLRKIGLRVRADNERAIAFYMREGYREVGRLANHYRENDTYVDVVLMERALPGIADRQAAPA